MKQNGVHRVTRRDFLKGAGAMGIGVAGAAVLRPSVVLAGMRTGSRRALLTVAEVAYADKVLATQSANLIAYWPLWEAAGSVADNYEGTAARDGAYTGVTLGQAGIGDGRTCPYFDKVNDLVAIYSASLDGAWDPQEVTIAGWLRVYDAATWLADSLNACQLRATADNYISILKKTDGTLRYRYEANNVQHEVLSAVQSSTDWLHVALTASKSGDAVKAYLGGAQIGVTKTGVGTWVGALDDARTLLGSGVKTAGDKWYGWEAHWALWKTPLTGPEIAALAVV